MTEHQRNDPNTHAAADPAGCLPEDPLADPSPRMADTGSALRARSGSGLQEVTSDFIFGTLATDDLRLEELRKRQRGLRHDERISPIDPTPEDEVTITVTVGADLSVSELRCYVTTDGIPPDESCETTAFSRAQSNWDTLTWSFTETWQATIPPQPEGTLVRYRIAGMAADGATIGADADEDTGEPGTFAYTVDRSPIPEWVHDAVIYHVFVDRFAPSPGNSWREPDDLSGIWGGTLQGVISRLDHIVDLGATAIWLSPIFPSPTHHGYDATDYHGIEPRLGNSEDLQLLIELAHVRGIRILLDFVASHVSNEHPAFLKARQDEDSAERSWFTFHRDGSYRSYLGVETMPKVAVDDDGAAGYLIDAAQHWLRMGVDGFRLDHAQGPSRGFWSRFRRAVREVNPEAMLLGEIVESADTMASYQGRLDGTLDFLLLQQVRAFLGFDVIGADAFGRFLQRHLEWFGDRLVLPSFLDNHDMNRFLWVVNGDKRRLKLAALLQFALPQPPIIYYGTEVGLSQWHDLEYPDGTRRSEESRTPMLWGDEQDDDLRDFYTALIAARRATGIARGSGVRMLPMTNADLLAIHLEGDGQHYTLLLNRSEAAVDVPLTELTGAGQIVFATGKGVEIAGSMLHLPAMAGALVGSVDEPL
ncbi:alpha-amylase family glycosyl hydrolase [soil metagenome]